MSDQATFVQVSSWQRFAVIVLYIISTIGILWGLAEVVTSKNCHADSGCDHRDQIIYAVVGVFSFMFAFMWSVLGIRGLLPGAKKRQL